MLLVERDVEVLGGSVVVVLSLLCWGGQLVSWFFPDTGTRLSLMEAEETVEPAYFADIRGEALWDTLTLWTMPVAGILLIIDSSAWPYFGMVGGGMYFYFAGRGISTRRSMQKRGYRIGATHNIQVGYLFLAVWGLMGLVVVASAVSTLAGP